MELIGRIRERKILDDCYQDIEPRFVAVYGRRRVGKTWLIREHFQNRFEFYVSGSADESMQGQLENFRNALRKYFKDEVPMLKNWKAAFWALEAAISKDNNRSKKIIFIDELPWLDTPKSGFLSALEYFWNSFAQARPDILLIVCGSAASWMIKNLINNYGGLHNRVTDRIELKPFSLAECEEYLKSKGIVFNRYQIAEAYMIFGGIPYYLNVMEKGLSLNQNIDRLLFVKDAKLGGEYERLFHSLFRHSEIHMKIVAEMSKNNDGLSRQDILSATGLSNGGGFSKAMTELEQCGLVSKTYDFNKRRRGEYYRVADFFSIFHMKYLAKRKPNDEHYWSNFLLSPSHSSWCGYAFERLCFAHIQQIKQKLGINGVMCEVSSWRSKTSQHGAQIDLLIDRADGVINLCEIKYYSEELAIDSKLDAALQHKRDAFRSETGTRKALHQTLISTYGAIQNAYKNNIQSEVLLDDLFAYH